MKNIILLVFVLLFSFVNAVGFDDSVVLNTSISNSSVTFSVSVNITNVTIESDYVYLYNVTYFSNATTLMECGNVNHSGVNMVLDSVNFSCNVSVVGDDGEVLDEDLDSSGGSSGNLFYFLPSEDLEVGYSKVLRKGFGMRIVVNENYHYLKVENVSAARALISISSEVKRKWLFVGEEWFVDIDGDSVCDLDVKLNSVIRDYANVSIMKIEGEALDENPCEDVSEDYVFEEGISGEIVRDLPLNGRDNFVVAVVAGIVALFFIVIIVLNLRRPRWKKRMRRNRKLIRKHYRKSR